MKTKILSIGGALPQKTLTNNDFIKLGLETSDEWITTRTGIKKRHICSNSNEIIQISTKACEQAIKNSPLTNKDIDLMIVATSTAPYSGFPSLACHLQNNLQLNPIPAFDISAACTGFNYALTIGQQFIENNTAKNVLIVAADALSSLVDWKDRSTCILFGDAAAAVILSQSKEQKILYSKLFSNGSDTGILTGDKENKIKMKGKQVFKNAVQYCISTIEECLEKTKLTIESFTHIIPHQANQRILDQLKLKLSIHDDQLISTVANYGNTSAASIPYALYELHKKNNLKKGDKIMMIGFGAGFTWGINLVEWSQ
ncbi:MAG: beta-ketoacyl-ACP synthase III [bacterium]